MAPLHAALQRGKDRRDAHAHRLDAEAVRHLGSLFEPPEDSEGFVLHLVENGPVDRSIESIRSGGTVRLRDDRN
ncbi:MAG TPA: hypothetical protein VEX57_19545 [Microlunatus sp.]|nr:hypothetical protein [Microlunatus sp.]